jgi:hypothetical protein
MAMISACRDSSVRRVISLVDSAMIWPRRAMRLPIGSSPTAAPIDAARHHRNIDRVDVRRTSVALRLIGHRFLLIAGCSILSARIPLLAKHKPCFFCGKESHVP